MGCHTYFYRLTEKVPTIDEVKNAVIEGYKGLIEFEESDPDPDMTQEEISDYIKEMKKSIERIEDNTYSFSELMTNYLIFAKDDKRLRYGSDGDMYEEVGADELYYYKDMFRVTDYPADEIYSFDGFVKFYEKNETVYHDRHTKEEVFEMVKYFFDNYIGGFIVFG